MSSKPKRPDKPYESALHLLRPASPIWKPPVLTCSAIEWPGIEEIWQTVSAITAEKMDAIG